jgi:hypothetical protein
MRCIRVDLRTGDPSTPAKPYNLSIVRKKDANWPSGALECCLAADVRLVWYLLIFRSALVFAVLLLRYSRVTFAGTGLGFGEADAGFGALLALPLVVVAQARLVFLYLRFQFGEGLFASGANIFAGTGGMHGAGGQR